MSKQNFNPLIEMVTAHTARIAELAKAESLVDEENQPVIRNIVQTVEVVLKCATGAIKHRDYELTTMCIAFARGGFVLIQNLVTCPDDPLTKMMALDFEDGVKHRG